MSVMLPAVPLMFTLNAEGSLMFIPPKFSFLMLPATAAFMLSGWLGQRRTKPVGMSPIKSMMSCLPMAQSAFALILPGVFSSNASRSIATCAERLEFGVLMLIDGTKRRVESMSMLPAILSTAIPLFSLNEHSRSDSFMSGWRK